MYPTSRKEVKKFVLRIKPNKLVVHTAKLVRSKSRKVGSREQKLHMDEVIGGTNDYS